MPSQSRIRSIAYASLAGLGLGLACYGLGSVHGADRALMQFRDLSFQTAEDAMRRQLRYDTLLANGRVEDARRAMGGVAWSHYSTLEDDARGLMLPSTEKMRNSIDGIRTAVAAYCGSDAAAFHAGAKIGICREYAARR